MITDQLQGVGTISFQPLAIDRVARYIDGVATMSFGQTSVTTAVSLRSLMWIVLTRNVNQ